MPRTTSGADTVLEGRLLRLQRLLLAWYRSDARPLAWRRTHDPYRIMVSEIMLQQTQVARVQPIYGAFIERFPTVQSLAAAPRGDVLRAWRGLGYNRRAVSLHRAAQIIAGQHAGRVPDSLVKLRELPGVGEYTARAVLAFAYRRDTAPVDVNVARVVSRAVVGEPLTRKETQDVADGLVPAGRGSVWSAALMDLGARYCTTATPRCSACPVAAACAWRLAGDADPAAQVPDPAAATALQSRPQGAFAGSDRYHRGRLVDMLRRGPVECDDLPKAAELDDTGRLVALTRSLVEEGMAEWSEGTLHLPGAERPD